MTRPSRRLRWALAAVTGVSVLAAGFLAIVTNAGTDDTGARIYGFDWIDRNAPVLFVSTLAVMVVAGVYALVLGWRSDDEPAVPGLIAPALVAAADRLAVTMREELRDELEARQLVGDNRIDLALAGYADDGGPDPAVVDRLGELAATVDAGRCRLVIRGRAGSGKSTTLVLLADALLAARGPSDPVPVTVNLSTWDPRAEHLDDVIRRRVQTVRGRRRRRRRRPGRLTVEPTDLVATRRVLPVLDGIDELPRELWPRAQVALAAALGVPDREFVLACTSDAFTDLVPAEAVNAGGTRVLTIQPVDATPAIGYLVQGRLAGDRRWEPLFEHLRSERDSVLATTLSSPLWMYLTRTVYRDRSTDPAALIGYATREAVEAHLLSRYLPSAYSELPQAGRGADARRYRGDQARRWLTHLARSLERQGGTAFVWWLLPELMPRGTRWLLDPVRPQRRASGRMWHSFGRRLAGGMAQTGGTVALALPILYVSALLTRWANGTMGSSLSQPVGEWLTAIVDVWPWPWRDGGPTWPMFLAGFAVVTVLGGLAYALWSGMQASDAEVLTATSARAAVAGDRALALARAGYLAVVVVPATVLALLAFVLPNLTRIDQWLLDHGLNRSEPTELSAAREALVVAVAPLTLAVVVGLGVVAGTAWSRFRLAGAFLALTGRFPLRLLDFLDDAHARGVLRRNGAVYEFRHRSVQRYLAHPERFGTRDLAGTPPPL